MNLINSFSVPANKNHIVKQLEEPRRESSKMRTNVRFLSNNMNLKKRPNCAETLKCMDNVNSVTHALMLMENTNCKEKHISQATLWRRCAPSSTKREFACTENDANFCTLCMIWNQNYRIFKPWKKEADLPNRGIIKSAKIQVLSAFGLIWSQGMDVEHQRDHVLHVLNKLITRITKRTCRKFKKKTSLKKTHKCLIIIPNLIWEMFNHFSHRW